MKFVNLLNANIRKEFIELKRYLPNTMSLLFTFYFVFLAMFFGIQLVGDPAHMDTNIQYVIVNYVFWYLTVMTMQSIGFTVTVEATRGTLEQLYMSPMGVWRILFARISGMIFIHFMIIIVLLFMSMATAGQWLYLNPGTVLPILVLTLCSMIGVSFMIAGASVIFKQIQAFLQISQFIFMALTFIPLSVAPFLAYAPFVKGVDMIRLAMINDLTLIDFGVSDYVILFLNAAVYITLGIWIYLQCEKFAMKKGLLGHY